MKITIESVPETDQYLAMTNGFGRKQWELSIGLELMTDRLLVHPASAFGCSKHCCPGSEGIFQLLSEAVK